ncbi:phosphoribosylpyrophosphate synthetase [Aquimarina sp. U1-2]|uniref:phosphoribosylpyrophosphate synthetase n=1 Tax=Aquimarina sp. U1-2 TaxID=2823141 RepID=UPI001AECE555|nr:phosphoribosylpyrophosphate synthetase [Aquimarina sp. U1-2]MBP2831954.1 phosphoribosylpyrophosphate synthetase [Aquimarina sp. U1-2]
MKNNFDTLSQAVSALQDAGYTEDFNLNSDCIECKPLDMKLFVKDFEIDEMYRFEGQTNPSDSSILYAISSDTFELKGLLVDAYGVYSEALTPEMIQKLKYKP